MSAKNSQNTAVQSGIRQERRFLIWSNENFFLREAYKAARTNILFSLTGKEGCNVVAVTSADQGEGKSITAANLAMSFADMGKRVLLVDCDLRRPKVGRLLGLSAEQGLTDVLIRRTALQDVILPYRAGKPLRALTSGRIPPNPSELLASGGMAALLNILKAHYDFIVLDTPPLEAVTDAAVLAPLVDGYVFVVRAGESDRRSVRHALEQLSYANAHILGTVLNGTSASGGGYSFKKSGVKKYGERYTYQAGGKD